MAPLYYTHSYYKIRRYTILFEEHNYYVELNVIHLQSQAMLAFLDSVSITNISLMQSYTCIMSVEVSRSLVYDLQRSIVTRRTASGWDILERTCEH